MLQGVTKSAKIVFQTRVTATQQRGNEETAPLQQQPQASGGDDNIYDELYEMEEGGNNEGGRGREAATGTARPKNSARSSGVPSYYVGDPGH